MFLFSNFFVFTKAFNTESHQILKKKLEWIGIRGTYSWFDSYYSNKRHVTKNDDKVNNEAEGKFWIPQGTILGPILYLIFAKELCSLDDCDTISLFQDLSWDDINNESGQMGVAESYSWYKSYFTNSKH